MSAHPSAIAERPQFMRYTPELNDLVFAELVDLVCVKTKPFAQNFTCVLSKRAIAHQINTQILPLGPTINRFAA